ncbi:MAG: hypothetical protein EBU59_06350 [Planctomycetia bacterium]|nr:hypothetical protein [Planctomycetia bacterium]
MLWCLGVFMRTTVRIDDSLLADLKRRAHDERCSLTELVNRVLRRGVRALGEEETSSEPYHETTHAMGPPKLSLDKALSLAAALEDEQAVEKLLRRK